MVSFFDFIYDLQAYGFYETILPLLLFFTIIFAALEKTMVLGHTGKNTDTEDRRKPKTNLNIVVSLIIALLVIVNTDVVLFVNEFLSNTGVIIIIAIVFMLFIALFAPGVTWASEKWFKWVGLGLAIVAVIWALKTQNLVYDLYFLDFISGDLLSWLIAAGILIGVIVILKKDSGSSRDDENESPLERLARRR